MVAFIKFIPYILVALFVGALVFFYAEWQHEKIRRQYFEDIHNSNIAYATKKDFKDAIDSLDIPIPVRNIKEVNNITTHTTTNIVTKIKDSIVGTQTEHCIDWHNEYSSLKGCFETGVKSDHKDTLDLVLRRKPTKKFLFIKYAKKDTLQIFNKDPSSKYTVRSFRRL